MGDNDFADKPFELATDKESPEDDVHVPLRCAMTVDELVRAEQYKEIKRRIEVNRFPLADNKTPPSSRFLLGEMGETIDHATALTPLEPVMKRFTVHLRSNAPIKIYYSEGSKAALDEAIQISARLQRAGEKVHVSARANQGSMVEMDDFNKVTVSAFHFYIRDGSLFFTNQRSLSEFGLSVACFAAACWMCVVTEEV